MQPMRYRNDFRTTYAILSFYGIELTFDKPMVDQPMRYRIQPMIDQPMRLLIQFDSTKSNNYLCDSELNFDKPTIDQPMRYRKQFDKPKVMITYGCIQEMECNPGLSEVLGYPTREMSTPTREMFVNPYVGIVHPCEGNVHLTPTREFGRVILETEETDYGPDGYQRIDL